MIRGGGGRRKIKNKELRMRDEELRMGEWGMGCEAGAWCVVLGFVILNS
jgi:hypothetical protein